MQAAYGLRRHVNFQGNLCCFDSSLDFESRSACFVFVSQFVICHVVLFMLCHAVLVVCFAVQAALVLSGHHTGSCYVMSQKDEWGKGELAGTSNDSASIAESRPVRWEGGGGHSHTRKARRR